MIVTQKPAGGGGRGPGHAGRERLDAAADGCMERPVQLCPGPGGRGGGREQGGRGPEDSAAGRLLGRTPSVSQDSLGGRRQS